MDFSPHRLLTTCEFSPLRKFIPPIKRYDLPCSGFIWEHDCHLHGYYQVQLMRSQIHYQINEQFQERWDDSHFLIYHAIPVCRHLHFIALSYHSRYVPYAPMRRWQTLSLFALSKLPTKYYTLFYYSLYLFTPTPSFFPFWAFQTDRQTKFFTPCSLSYFFSTFRRNSTGLAEL